MSAQKRIAGFIEPMPTAKLQQLFPQAAAFGAQFKGKSIRDPFVAGKDVDIVSRATITVRAAARTIRESSRSVARALLTPEAVK